MRTTLNVDDDLMTQAKAQAARQHRTLTSLVEEGLRKVLAQAENERPRSPVVLPVSRAGGGVLPGVDLDDSAGLLDIMDDHASS